MDQFENLTASRPCFVTHLECSGTGARLEADAPHNLSPEGHPLLVRYDLDALKAGARKESVAARPPDLWRYREFLPVRKPEHVVSLGENMTPVIPCPSLARDLGAEALFIKDEGRLPTGSFKARGVALAVSMAKAFGIGNMIMPSNGNAGGALAAYGRHARIAAHVYCPADTPPVNLAEIAFHGAKLHAVDGLIDECGRLAAETAADRGWFDCATLKEPYRIEGKKTMGLELAEQFAWRPPEVVFYPTGGGTGLIGMWKAFQELRAVGWLEGPPPRMVAVQAAGCAPIVKAFDEHAERAEPWPDARTIAHGIRVPSAIGDALILKAVRESGGFALAVDDDAIEAAHRRAAEREGLLLCPEGAATLAAYEVALSQDRIKASDRALLFNCASGLKYPLPAP
jgi:threonine synthase